MTQLQEHGGAHSEPNQTGADFNGSEADHLLIEAADRIDVAQDQGDSANPQRGTSRGNPGGG
jgi:hypothetical protein